MMLETAAGVFDLATQCARSEPYYFTRNGQGRIERALDCDLDTLRSFALEVRPGRRIVSETTYKLGEIGCWRVRCNALSVFAPRLNDPSTCRTERSVLCSLGSDDVGERTNLLSNEVVASEADFVWARNLLLAAFQRIS